MDRRRLHLDVAALLLSSGALTDRVGARRTFGLGLALFVVASLACALAPTLPLLVVARFVQGSAAAAMMPLSLALIGQAYSDPVRRARAVALWAMGGSVASSSGPLFGGVLTLLDWRTIFFINVPVGAAALVTLRRTPHSPRRPAPFDWAGQVTAVVAMAALTYGAIEAGQTGLASPRVLLALAVAVTAAGLFLLGHPHDARRRGRDPVRRPPRGTAPAP